MIFITRSCEICHLSKSFFIPPLHRLYVRIEKTLLSEISIWTRRALHNFREFKGREFGQAAFFGFFMIRYNNTWKVRDFRGF